MTQRAIVAAVLCGLVAIVAVPLVIFAYGRHDPSPPSLEDNPNPAIPGEVLFFDEDGCVVRARASGERTEIATCDVATNPASFVAWIDGETIAVAQSWTAPAGEWFDVTTVNLRTGEQGSVTLTVDPAGFPFGPSGQESVHGERVSVGEHGEITILRGTEKQEIHDFDVAEYRAPQFLTWSPDGEWMLLTYYDDGDQELWVLSRDGKTGGTLAKGLRQPVVSWYIEGVGVWPEVTVGEEYLPALSGGGGLVGRGVRGVGRGGARSPGPAVGVGGVAGRGGEGTGELQGAAGSRNIVDAEDAGALLAGEGGGDVRLEVAVRG